MSLLLFLLFKTLLQMVWVKEIFVTRQDKALKDTFFLMPFRAIQA
jgi:hypothetical protein